MKNALAGALGIAYVLGVLALGIFLLAAGWVGIEYQFGYWWGIAAVVLGLLFRFTLPLTVGVFYCARDIWDLHWFVALAIAAPGLILMVPGLIAAVFAGLRRR